MNTNLTLKNNLKSFRFLKDQITQKDLAAELNVSRQTILAIEKGKFNPSVVLALSMAEYFECKVEDIFILKRETDK
ncbi:helix-turn-helix transcriptional regulator [Acidobacteriota bacterium]